MSRREGINISAIIDECKDYKDQYNALKKKSEPLETQIKDYARQNGLDTIKSNNWQANISVTPKTEFNEEKAIDILKLTLDKKVLNKIVKKKEYIDEDALEKAIYNGDVDASSLASCTIQKEPTVRLTIGKIKN